MREGGVERHWFEGIWRGMGGWARRERRGLKGFGGGGGSRRTKSFFEV